MPMNLTLLFSGCLDKTIFAYLSSSSLSECEQVPFKIKQRPYNILNQDLCHVFQPGAMIFVLVEYEFHISAISLCFFGM